MHCTFHSNKLGPCTVHVLASGRHGFSSPKLIRISSGEGDAVLTSVYRFLNRSISLHAHDELSNSELCRMAIAQFLRTNEERHVPVTAPLEFTTAPYRGSLYAKNRSVDQGPVDRGDATAVSCMSSTPRSSQRQGGTGEVR
ncbi:MAG: hypothetical protein ABIT83_11180 [Massilia sp.]